MKAIIFISPLMFYSNVLAQQEWISVGKSTANFEFLIKDFSKTYRQDVYDGWVKTIYPTRKTKNKKGVIINLKGKTSLSNWEINCSEKEYQIKHTFNYNSNGTVINSFDDLFGWSKIAPDSMAEGIYEEVCYKN